MNGDGFASGIDLVLIVEALNTLGAVPLPLPVASNRLVDVNGDGYVSAFDLILEVSRLNGQTTTLMAPASSGVQNFSLVARGLSATTGLTNPVLVQSAPVDSSQPSLSNLSLPATAFGASSSPQSVPESPAGQVDDRAKAVDALFADEAMDFALSTEL